MSAATRKPATAHTCCEDVHDPGTWPRFHVCRAAAKVEHDGKWYCGRHSPAGIAARQAKREARWKEQERMIDAREEARKEDLRKRDAYPQLVAALRKFANASCDDDGVIDSMPIEDCTELTEGDLKSARALLRSLGESE